MKRARGVDPRAARRETRLLDLAVCVGAAVSLPDLELSGAATTLPSVSPADVAGVLRRAEALRLDALAARGFRSLGVPASSLDVESRERSALAASVMLHGFRQQLTGQLQAHGVRHAYLKGTLSDALFWRGTGLRGVTDVDVLVRREDERAATEALEALGFHSPVRYGRVTDAATQERLFALDVGGKPLDVDLHVGVSRDPPYADPGADIVARSVIHATPFGGIPGPTPEDAVLQATLNLATAKFFSGRTKLMLDVACYCRRYDLAYDVVVERALKARAGWALWALLSLVRERFGVAVPDAVLREVQPGPSRAVLARRLAGVSCEPRVPSSRAMRVLVEWPLVKRPLWPAELFVRWAGWRVGDVVAGRRPL